MFAVFQSGGKQHRVSEGDVVKLELLTAEPGEEVIFDKVLLVDGLNTLAFDLPDARRPGGADQRDLAIGLKEIAIR